MHIYAIAYVLSVHQSVLRIFVSIMSLMRSSHSTKVQHQQCPTANRDHLFQFSKGGKSHKGTGVGSGQYGPESIAEADNREIRKRDIAAKRRKRGYNDRQAFKR